MRERNEERFQSKKHALMETCFACYAENGLSAVGIRGLAKACGCVVVMSGITGDEERLRFARENLVAVLGGGDAVVGEVAVRRRAQALPVGAHIGLALAAVLAGAAGGEGGLGGDVIFKHKKTFKGNALRQRGLSQ